jgi:hypothetical protein
MLRMRMVRRRRRLRMLLRRQKMATTNKLKTLRRHDGLAGMTEPNEKCY